jgi:hypothetical protein
MATLCGQWHRLRKHHSAVTSRRQNADCTDRPTLGASRLKPPQTMTNDPRWTQLQPPEVTPRRWWTPRRGPQRRSSMTAATHGSKRITGVSILVRKLQASVAMSASPLDCRSAAYQRRFVRTHGRST